jgi:hypothetical protein
MFSNQKILIWVNFGGTCNRRFWSILRPFGLFYGHLIYFMVIWYIFSHFGMLCQEKSGNPALYPNTHSFKSELATVTQQFLHFPRVAVTTREQSRFIHYSARISKLIRYFWREIFFNRFSKAVYIFICSTNLVNMHICIYVGLCTWILNSVWPDWEKFRPLGKIILNLL